MKTNLSIRKWIHFSKFKTIFRHQKFTSKKISKTEDKLQRFPIFWKINIKISIFIEVPYISRECSDEINYPPEKIFAICGIFQDKHHLINIFHRAWKLRNMCAKFWSFSWEWIFEIVKKILRVFDQIYMDIWHYSQLLSIYCPYFWDFCFLSKFNTPGGNTGFLQQFFPISRYGDFLPFPPPTLLLDILIFP